MLQLIYDVNYQTIAYRLELRDDPAELKNAKVLQVRFIFIIKPEIMEFSPGDDGDEVAFISLEQLKEIDEPEYDYLKMIISPAAS